jgi:biopolymer transport protein ExbB
MWEFLRAGGPFMFLLILTSIVGVAFIVERGLALRWHKIIPPEIEEALDKSGHPIPPAQLRDLCLRNPSPAARLLLIAQEHLPWPKAENIDTIETRARHEIIGLERGLVVLEVVVGIAPLLGLVGTIHGLITLFGGLGASVTSDNAILAKGIAIALNTTLTGLLIAIPSLVAWSYYTKKVDSLAVEMELLCDKFLRQQYREKPSRA